MLLILCQTAWGLESLSIQLNFFMWISLSCAKFFIEDQRILLYNKFGDGEPDKHYAL